MGELLKLLAISVSWKFEIRAQEILVRRIFSPTARNFLIILRNVCFKIHVCGVEATVRSLDVPNFAKCAFNVTSCHSSVKYELIERSCWSTNDRQIFGHCMLSNILQFSCSYYYRWARDYSRMKLGRAIVIFQFPPFQFSFVHEIGNERSLVISRLIEENYRSSSQLIFIRN